MKKFQNGLTVDEVITKSLTRSFLETQVYINCIKWQSFERTDTVTQWRTN